MPVMWKCPGQPHCRKIYLYARGLKAHIPSCKHARKKEVHQRRNDMETMLTIIMFVEDQQKGNVTMSRLGVPSFQVQRPVFSRYPQEGDRSRLCREPMGGYPFLEERRTNVRDHPVIEERRTNIRGYPVLEERRTNVRGYPVLEERRTNVRDHPVLEERRTNVLGYPVLEERRTNFRGYPVLEERYTNIRDHPVLEERRTNVLGYPVLEEKRTNVRGYPILEERRTNVRGYPVLEERRTHVRGYPFMEERLPNVQGYPSYYTSSFSDSYSSSSTYTPYTRDIRNPLPSIGQLATH